MKVAVAYTKTSELGIKICNNFCLGVERCGDEVIQLKHPEQLNKLQCDCIVQLCPYNSLQPISGPSIKLRKDISRFVYKKETPLVILDTGFFKNDRFGESENRYLSVGLGFKGCGKYFNEDSPPDRWEDLGIKLAPYRTQATHILVLGQNEKGISVAHLNFRKWIVETIHNVQKITKRPIVFRTHPNQKYPVKIKNVKVVSHKIPIKQHLRNCWACVAKTTNGVTEAIIEGVPVFTDDPMCISYPISNHDINNINSPILFEREQWCYNTAYSQFNNDEFRNGSCWKYWREKIENLQG